MKLPVLALTLGDVAGIGPEIAAKTLLRHPELRRECVPVVIGDADAMRRGVEIAGGDAGVIRIIDSPRRASNDPRTIEMVQAGPPLGNVPAGRISAEAGDAAYRFVVQACSLAKASEVDAIVTAPLNKAAMHAGGHKWPGHTELLAHEFGVTNFSLVLSAGELYFFHLTTHVSLKSAIGLITPERTDEVLDLAGGFGRRARMDERADRPRRCQPACGRGRSVRNRGTGCPCSGRRSSEIPRAERRRPPPSRRADSSCRERQMAARRRVLSRPGPRAVQGGIWRQRCEHHRGPAGGESVGRSRHGVRHCGQRCCARRQSRVVVPARGATRARLALDCW